MVKHTKGFKGLSKKVLSAILAASMIMTSSSFVMAAEPTEEPVAVESVANETAIGRVSQGDLTETVKEAFAAVNLTYNGKVQHPEVTINNETEADGNFHVNYTGDCIDAGTYKVQVVFDNEWTGTDPVDAEFTIKKASIASASVELEQADTFEYNGTVQRPNVVVTTTLGSGDDAEEYTLQDDEYEITYTGGDSEGIQVGTYQMHITAVEDSNFADEVTITPEYKITKTEMSDSMVKVEAEDIPYDDAQNIDADRLKDYLTVTDVALGSEITNYDVTIEDEETAGNLGVHNFVIEPADNTKNYAGGEVKGQYKVVASESFASKLKSVKYKAVYDNDEDLNVYDKAVERIKAQITGAGIKESEYEIVTSESDWNNAGEYTLVVEGQQIYEGQTAEIPVVISPKSINKDATSQGDDFNVAVTQGTHPGSGDAADVVVSIKDNGAALEEGVDFTFETIEENDEKYVLITGIGNYTTAIEAIEVTTLKWEYDVDENRMYLNDPSISAEVVKEDIAYTEQEVTLSNSDIVLTETDGSDVITLKPGVDYYIDDSSYKHNDAPGTATVTVKGMGDYAGEITVEFEIVGTSFSDTFDVSMKKDTFDINTAKSIVKSNIVVQAKGSTGTYSKYKVEYLKDGEKYTANTFEPGAYVARVTSTETKYSGYVDLNFIVLGEEVEFNVSAVEDQVYTGAQITPAVTVTSENGKITYKAGEDYEVVYGENVQAGNNAGSVTVNMIGEYSGSSTVYFNITKADQTITMTNPLQERDLANGTRTTTSKNCTLKLGFGVPDTMNLSYESSDKSVATVNNGVITYQGVGECTITVTANETNNCKAVSLPITVKVGKVGTPTFTPSVTSKTAAKSITVTSSTVRGADGFEVEYSIRPDWWRSTTVDFENTGSKLYRQTIKTYHSNKKYYIRVRAYQVVDGVKQYSDWSPAKTATTK